MADALAARIVAMARVAERVDEQRIEYRVLKINVAGESQVETRSMRGGIRVNQESAPVEQQLQMMLNEGWRIETTVPGASVTGLYSETFIAVDREHLGNPKTVEYHPCRHEIAPTAYVVLRRRMPLT